MTLPTCANCNTSRPVSFTSVLANIDSSRINDDNNEQTIIEAIAELFGVSEAVGCLVDTFQEEKDVPYLCQQCLLIIQNCLEFKNQFLRMCHWNGTFGLILVKPADTQNVTGQNSGDETVNVNATDSELLQLEHHDDDLNSLSHLEPEQQYSGAQTLNTIHSIHQSQSPVGNAVPQLEGDCVSNGTQSAECTTHEYFVNQRLNEDSDCSDHDSFVAQSQRDTVQQSSSPLRTKSGTKPETQSFQCPSCPISFPFLAYLLAHIQSKHVQIGNPSFQCANCAHVTKSTKDLAIHMFTHTKEAPFSCSNEGCSFTAKRKDRLKNHVQKKHGRTGSILGVEMMSPMKSNTSLSSPKSETRLRFGSPKCLAVSPPLPLLVSRHESKRRLEKCRIVSTKRFKCDHDKEGCKREFPFQAKLLAHRVARHSFPPGWTPNSGLHCPVSPCTFNTKYEGSLSIHCFAHTKEKQFKCDVPDCDYSSVTLKMLKGHFVGTHKSDGLVKVHHPRNEHQTPEYKNIGTLKHSPLSETRDNFDSNSNPYPYDSSDTSMMPLSVNIEGRQYHCKICNYSAMTLLEFRSHCLLMHNRIVSPSVSYVED